MLDHLYELVPQRAARHSSDVAFGAEEGLGWRVLTSGQFVDLVDRLAIELATIGVRESDRVVLWMPNHWRTPLYLFALWKLGAIAVPFDRETNPEAGARILESIAPRCVLVGFGDRPAWLGTVDATEWWDPGSRVASAAGAGPWSRPAEELAAIFFTSGTTGAPKGCMITHANLCSQIDALGSTIVLDTECRLASILPLSHLFELTVGMLYPFSMGAAVHYIPSRRAPDIIRVFSEQRITHMLAVPQFLTLMGHALDDQVRAKLPGAVYRALLSSVPHMPFKTRRYAFWFVHRRLGGKLRTIASGGAELARETQLLWERFGVRIVQGFGVSECSPVVAAGMDDGSTPVGSVGKPLRDVEVRAGADGELHVRGPNVMRGYWNDPQRTAEVLHDGWYATGDLGAFDASGNIIISGRARDLIVFPSGMNVWPQDVEDVLRDDPLVKDAVVIAVPSPSGGATLHAYLLPARAGAGESAVAAIVASANGRLAQHQRIVTASWWPESDFPRTAIGKVRRAMLPMPSAAEVTRVESVLATDDPVAQAIAGVARVAAVLSEQTLGELGLDSFGFVELALAIEEKTGKAVSDGDLSTEMTVAQVRVLAASAPEAGSEGANSTGEEQTSIDQPNWPYTWGRIFRVLGLPFDILYRFSVTRTVVIGRERLRHLPRSVIFAGTHHSWADLPLVRVGIEKTPARRLARRLVVAAGAGGFPKTGLYATYSKLAFGLYPLRQLGEREASLRRLAQLARKGNAILIFPQGTHADPALERSGDAAVRFRPGVGYLAAALGATVVPFGLAGTETMIPPKVEAFQGKVIAGIPVSIRRGPLAIAFGEPVTMLPDELPQTFAERLQIVCYALTREAEQALERQRAQP